MKNIKNYEFEELKQELKNIGEKPFRAEQIYKWLYEEKVKSFEEMTNLSKELREKLNNEYTICNFNILRKQESKDGTVKYLFDVLDGNAIETVLMKYHHGYSLCVSSQIGCKMGCKFCASTGIQFIRSLSAGEIVEQVLAVEQDQNVRISNIVFMGMGEPLDNLDAVLRSLEILTAKYGYGWSPKRITVSTVGLRRGLERFLNESDCHLAVSLHSPFPAQRAELMPAEKAFPITKIVELLRKYDFSKQRRLSFEYIVFGGVNDKLIYAKELVKLLRGLDCRINLIRFHAIPDVDLQGADMHTMLAFRDYLTQHGIFATIRASRGEDIFAACGMLSTAEQQAEKKKNSIDV